MNDYRDVFYQRYHTAFKRASLGEADYEFNNTKLVPLLRPWCRELERSQPCIDLGGGNGSLRHRRHCWERRELYIHSRNYERRSMYRGGTFLQALP